MALAIYEMEQIGVNDSFEAVAVHFYCSPGCQNKGTESFPVLQSISVSPEQDDGFPDGTICETCNKPLTR